MALNFPQNPTTGDVYQTYVFDGTKWVSEATLVIDSVAPAFNKANDAYSTATLAFDRANLANGTANTALINASSAFDRANVANTTANTVTIVASAAFDRANLANGTANTALINASSAFDRANLANGTANTALVNASSAFDRANTANLIPVQRNSSLIGTRNKINFLQGSNITLTVVDDSAGDRVNVSISAVGGGGGGSNGVADSFETINKNLGAYDATLYYDGNGILANIVYVKPDSNTITKTLNFTGSVLNSIALSGNTPAGITLTKTLNYSGDVLVGYSYS
jgi:hypothetical protein